MKPSCIALTGVIGSGKSTVAKILSQEYHFAVVDCDTLAREVSEDPAVLAEISALLGADYVEDNKLNRKKVREIVFANPELYKQYSALFFDRIKMLLQQRVVGLQIVFVEIPILSAFCWDWKEVWLVESDGEKRIARVVLRDGVSEQNVNEILSRQSICEGYTRKILNNGTLDDLRAQVAKTLQAADLI